jgi:hypothetical protein
MRPGRRFGLSAEQKCDVWRRWKVGQTLHEIGRAFGKDHNSIRGVVARHGGIVPAVRRRALLALTLREREEISRGLASGSSFREIARCLERAVSTVSREVARHGGRPAYRASQADGQAWQSALRPKRCLLSINLKLRDIVASKLMLDWSPKQISGWLKTQYPDDESMHVSHETIYRSLFIVVRTSYVSDTGIHCGDDSFIWCIDRSSISVWSAEITGTMMRTIGTAASAVARLKRGTSAAGDR